jgi:hypothetical protein
MKKIFILPTVIAFAMICSCQKQDSAAEQQVAQRKKELDAHETDLEEREKDLNLRATALDEREKALAKREKAAVNAGMIPPDAQSQDTVRNAARAKAERDTTLQQLPPEIRALIPDSSEAYAAEVEKERLTQERLAERQLGPEQLQIQRQHVLETIQKLQISGAAVAPGAETTSPTPHPAAEVASPNP